MANITSMGAYATDVVLTQQIFYGQSLSLGYQMLLAVSTQVVGYSIGGILRPFVVWPSSMIWPGALVNSALFNTFHKVRYGKTNRHLSRQRFFLIAMVCSFIWYWVPGYLFTGLSMFNWICWIAPNNVVVNTLFGTATGLGMSVLTFDWSMISFFGSPLVTPVCFFPPTWKSLLSLLFLVVGSIEHRCFIPLLLLDTCPHPLLCVLWFDIPFRYWRYDLVTNSYNFAFFPISSTEVFDNTGASYNVSNIITDGIFDQAKYEAYSPVFLPSTRALSYGIALATFPAIVVHTYGELNTWQMT